MEWEMDKTVLSTAGRLIGFVAATALVFGAVSGSALARSARTNGLAAPTNSQASQAPANGLRAGATVRLKSGGPLMTVDNVEGDTVNCQWATEFGELATGAFPIAVLTIVGGPGWLPAPDQPAKPFYDCPSVTVDGRVTCLE
jgi:uncharacterized protein YodC (DUF2158 family)